MAKKRKFIIIIVGLLNFIFLSCSKELDMELPQPKPKIVIHGFLSPKENIKLLIQKGIPRNTIIDSFDRYIEIADVQIYENGEYFCTLHYQDTNEYLGSVYKAQGYYPKVGENYKVIIDVPGYSEVQASTIIPDTTKIVGLSAQRITRYRYNTPVEVNRCYLTIKDNPKIENYYMYKIESDNQVSYFWENINFIPQFYFSDDLIEGEEYTFDVDLEARREVDTTTTIFKLYNITRAHYFFIKSSVKAREEDHLPYLEDFSLPLSEPVPIYTNVENGAGIFTGVNYSKDSIQLIFSNEIENYNSFY